MSVTVSRQGKTAPAEYDQGWDVEVRPGGTGVEIFFRLGTEMRTSEVTVDIGTSSFEEVAEAMMRYNQVAAARAFGAALQKTRAPKLS